jgi:hypothetical protein
MTTPRRHIETNVEFHRRVWTDAEHWCPEACESDIPIAGDLRDVWELYKSICEMPDEDLRGMYSDLMVDLIDHRIPEDLATGTWVSLASLELDRRSKTD